ncbi:hypothetical protein [Kitasatospora sp. A2-31]|uniref:hypothetical protein n=1 Tax=Kitasatospora sp. A2-31 TaxID=2916414 RepID=UPI001EEB3EBD|nr:hypothetical protein [Kitasatospora sp. A2-31]MCG6498386.1 hypothetical protein [Kitasatospora sp. A2-31]
MEEIGRVGWFTIGVTTIALAGAGHAMAGAGRIAKEMLRTPDEERRAAASGRRTLESASGAGGWVLFGALVLAPGAIRHVLSGTETVVKEVVKEPAAR